MELSKAIQILRDHNVWRRYDGPIGEGPKMVDPVELGQAIDTVCDHFTETASWQDMKLVIAAEGSIYDEYNGPEKVLEAYPTEEAFYGEVLRRYRALKDEDDDDTYDSRDEYIENWHKTIDY